MHKNVIVKNLTLAETIAHRNPEVANELLIKNGYPASRDRDQLALQLNHFLLKQRDKALKALADIHPDKEMLFSNLVNQDNEDNDDSADGENRGHHYGKNKRKPCKNCGKHHNADGDDEFSNCCGYSNCSGCGGSCGTKSTSKGSMHFNAAGDEGANTTKVAALISNNMMTTLMVVGVISVAAIALVAISNKKGA